jgi:hypothetical protein
MRLWKHYAVSYQYDRPGYRSLLDQVSLLVIPVANPDGYEFTHLPTGDRMWRPNRNTCSGGLGIDPNRNFPFDFGEPGAALVCQSIPSEQANSSYHGDAPASEPETSGLRAAIASKTLNGLYNTVLVINLHSFGNYVTYSDGMGMPRTNDCTTTSNCSAADSPAMELLAGTGRPSAARMSDENSRAPYVTGQQYRMMYEISGGTIHDAAYGTLPFGAENALGMLVELTHTECGFKAENIDPTYLNILSGTLQDRVVHPALHAAPELDTHKWFDTAMEPYALPHIQRQLPTREHPAMRISLRKGLSNISFTPMSGTGVGSVDSSVLDGIGFRLYKWEPDPSYQFPHELMVDSTEAGPVVVRTNGQGTGSFSLCSGVGFTSNGWKFVGKSSNSPADQCFWEFTGTGQAPWRLTSPAFNMANTRKLRLAYSQQQNQNGTFRAQILVSGNGFVGCSRTNEGGCRIVAQLPYDNGMQVAYGGFRTQVHDVSDFDGQTGVQVRVVVEGSSQVTPSVRFYDFQVSGIAQ